MFPLTGAVITIYIVERKKEVVGIIKNANE